MEDEKCPEPRSTIACETLGFPGLSLGPSKKTRSPSANFYRFFFGFLGSPTKIDYRKRRKTSTLVLTSLLEDLGEDWRSQS